MNIKGDEEMLSVKDINLLEGQNKWLKKQNKSLQKEVKELKQKLKLSEERHDVLLNEYDELLHKTPENVSNCAECESDILLKAADLEMRCEKLEWWYKSLNKALDIKDELNRALRESGAIEQDADVVMLIVAKNREGRTGTI